jgi:NAD(P)H-dependent flavin oxidoreductase YrpB (nitropropane dioxygenase family)
MKDIRDRARELLRGYCRVCPVCDGAACAGEVPGMGGLGTGASFAANVRALAALKLNMRLVHDVGEPDTAIDLLGRRLSMPILAAPIGGLAWNMGGCMPEADYVRAVLTGCLSAGTLGCTGDGVPEEIHQGAFAALRAVSGQGIPFIKPWDEDEVARKLDLAAAAGAAVAGMDIDAAGLPLVVPGGRRVSPKGRAALRRIVERAGRPFLLKGLMTPDEALLALDAGVAGIVVSNHGGRVLDHTPGTAEVLGGIAKAVAGRCAVLVDGGVRSGADVLKMLALGADAVLIGRPVAVAAVGGGAEGVAALLGGIRDELARAMLLTGVASAAEVPERVLYGR